MRIQPKKTRLAATLGIALGTVTIAPQVGAEGYDAPEEPFAVAKLFFQLNDTDGDLGIHMVVDGDPWKMLEIDGPDDRRLLLIRTQSKLRRQGLTELRFESAEPQFDELPPARFFARFPEGEYDIEGMGLEGQEFESTVLITHVIPAAPDNLRVGGMETPEDCDEGPVPSVDAGAATISWDAVDSSHEDLGRAGVIDVERYEVAVEREDPPLTLTFDVGPNVLDFAIPAALLGSGDEIKFQVLVTDAGGNETSSESCFEVN